MKRFTKELKSRMDSTIQDVILDLTELSKEYDLRAVAAVKCDMDEIFIGKQRIMLSSKQENISLSDWTLHVLCEKEGRKVVLSSNTHSSLGVISFVLSGEKDEPDFALLPENRALNSLLFRDNASRICDSKYDIYYNFLTSYEKTRGSVISELERQQKVWTTTSLTSERPKVKEMKSANTI